MLCSSSSLSIILQYFSSFRVLTNNSRLILLWISVLDYSVDVYVVIMTRGQGSPV